MKKFILFIALASVLAGCNPMAKPEEVISEVVNPFKEYKVIEPEVVKKLEDGILLMESKDKGLVADKTSTHVISMKKTGSYATGEVRVLGTIAPEKLEEINKDRSENRKLNGVVSYTCVYEYSFKDGIFIWTSDYKTKYDIK